MKYLYDMKWLQCTNSLKLRLRGHVDYVTFSLGADIISLPTEIQSEMMGFKKIQYLLHADHNIMREFYTLNQGRHHTGK